MMQELIERKEGIIISLKDDIKEIENQIIELKKGNRQYVLYERKKLYTELLNSLWHSFDRSEEIKDCNEILEEFDNKFNIQENEIKVCRFHKYRFK
jgi:hypothetical protein